MKPDNVDVGRGGFARCLPNGCVAEVVMDDKLLNQRRTAKTATFIIFATPEEGIGFPLSLNGIGEGYDKLPCGVKWTSSIVMPALVVSIRALPLLWCLGLSSAPSRHPHAPTQRFLPPSRQQSLGRL